MSTAVHVDFFLAHMFEEDAELGIGSWVNGGVEHGEENVLQHLAKVRDKVPASEDVARVEEGQNIGMKISI